MYPTFLTNFFAKGKLFELQVGNEFRQDKLSSNFMLLHDEDILNTPDNFQNNNKPSNKEVNRLSVDMKSVGFRINDKIQRRIKTKMGTCIRNN